MVGQTPVKKGRQNPQSFKLWVQLLANILEGFKKQAEASKIDRLGLGGNCLLYTSRCV